MLVLCFEVRMVDKASPDGFFVVAIVAGASTKENVIPAEIGLGEDPLFLLLVSSCSSFLLVVAMIVLVLGSMLIIFVGFFGYWRLLSLTCSPLCHDSDMSQRGSALCTSALTKLVVPPSENVPPSEKE